MNKDNRGAELFDEETHKYRTFILSDNKNLSLPSATKPDFCGRTKDLAPLIR